VTILVGLVQFVKLAFLQKSGHATSGSTSPSFLRKNKVSHIRNLDDLVDLADLMEWAAQRRNQPTRSSVD
jgi:hypothetical protein